MRVHQTFFVDSRFKISSIKSLLDSRYFFKIFSLGFNSLIKVFLYNVDFYKQFDTCSIFAYDCLYHFSFLHFHNCDHNTLQILFFDFKMSPSQSTGIATENGKKLLHFYWKLNHFNLFYNYDGMLIRNWSFSFRVLGFLHTTY